MNALKCNSIDITESVATKLDLAYQRVDDNEISIVLMGEKTDYELTVILKADYEIIYFSCDLDIVAPADKYALITEAIVKVNERIWVGHFDLITNNNRIVYSLTIPFISSFLVDESIMESIMELISDECDKFSHYFLMILETSDFSDFAISTLFLDSAGEA